MLGSSFENLRDLDVCIGNARDVGEQGDWIGRLVLNESEHVGGGLLQVLVCSHSGKWDIVWEPIDS